MLFFSKLPHFHSASWKTVCKWKLIAVHDFFSDLCSEGIKFGGCIGACDTLPCKHGGFCREMYQNFSCDCEKSAYTGPTCQEDVSINFDGSPIQARFEYLFRKLLFYRKGPFTF